MCVIIVKPKGETIDTLTLMDAFWYNDDGGGLAWAEDGKLHMKKGFMDFESFNEFWSTRDWTDIPTLIHFRIKTHGEKNKKNTHPFWIHNKDLVFAHNGILPIHSTKNKSDTIMFNNLVLRTLPENFLNYQGIRIMLEDFCYQNSKLAFLDSNGEFTIIGEGKGEWKNGCWFSNLQHEYVRHTARGGSLWGTDDDYIDTDGSWVTSGRDDYRNVNGDSVDIDELIAAPDDASVIAELLGYKDWYCYICDSVFGVNEINEIDETPENIVLPQCPMCFTSDGVFGVDENSGLTINGKQVLGGKKDDDSK